MLMETEQGSRVVDQDIGVKNKQAFCVRMLWM